MQTFIEFLSESKNDKANSDTHREWHGKIPGIPKVFPETQHLRMGPKQTVITNTGVSSKHLWDIHDHLEKNGFRQEEGGMQYGGEESITYNHSDGNKKVLIIHDTNKKQLEVSTFHRHN